MNGQLRLSKRFQLPRPEGRGLKNDITSAAFTQNISFAKVELEDIDPHTDLVRRQKVLAHEQKAFVDENILICKPQTV